MFKNYLKLIILLVFLTVNLSVYAAPGKTWETAELITNNSTSNASFGEETGNELWYKIEVTEDGEAVFTLNSEEPLKFYWIYLHSKNNDGKLAQRASMGLNHSVAKNKVFKISDLAKGTYFIQLNRSSGHGGYSLKYVFNKSSYTNDTEPNNKYEEIKQTLINGETIQGHLGYYYHSSDTDKEDWYKIEVTENGEAVFTLNSEESLRLYWIYLHSKNSEGKLVQRASKGLNHAVAENAIFTISDLAKGTYYVQLAHSGGYGGYSLKYVFNKNTYTNDTEPNNKYEEVKQTISDGQTIQGHLGYYYHSSDTDKEDWYKIEVTEDGEAVFVVNSEESLRLYWIYLHSKNNEGKLAQRASKGLNHAVAENAIFTISDLAKGTYYVQLAHSGGYGGYSLKYVFNKNTYTNDTEPNNKYEEANQTLINGQTIQGHLGYYYSSDTDKEDWYKIEVTEDGEAVFVVNSEESLRLYWIYLHSKNNEGKLAQRASKGLNHAVAENAIFTISDLAKGTYYVQLAHSGGYGGYSLKYVFNKNTYTNDTEPNNKYEEANQTLINGQTIQGHLGYYYSSDTDKEDWYKIEVTEDGEAVFVVNSEESLRLYWIYLHSKNSEGKLVQRASKSLQHAVAKNAIFTISDLTKGTYYIQLVQSGGYGGYTLSYGLRAPLAGSPIRCSVTGNKSVRRGVPTCFTVNLENISEHRTDAFVVTLAFSKDMIFSKAVIPSKNGDITLKPEDVGKANDTVQTFFVPYLDPFETYSFKVYMEGVANPGGLVPGKCHLAYKTNNETQAAITTFIIGAVVTVASDKINDFIKDKVCEAVDLNEDEAKLYAKAVGLTVEELGMTKQKEGLAVYATKSLVKDGANKALELHPATAIASKIGNAVETVAYVGNSFRRRLYYWFYKEIGLIKEDKTSKKIAVADGKHAADRVVTSWDPNEKLGHIGYGDQNHIYNAKRLYYTINFENQKTATAPAYRIYIEDVLSEVFDINTVRFEETSHQGDNYYWKTNLDGNKLTWEIEGIELPPNVTPPEGEGFVSFSVELKPEYQVSGTRIENKATIIFDKNPAIVTNTWVNIIDKLEPSTSMQSYKYTKGEDSVTVFCKSKDNDNGSGVRHQMFYVSTDERETYSFIGENLDSLKYPIEKDRDINYYFYAIAVDNVGNVEQSIPQYIKFNPLINSIDSPEATYVSVYPNPSQDVFYIQILDKYQYDYLQVLSVDGKLLFTQNCLNSDDNIKIDLTNYPSGIYLINFMGRKTSDFIKLVKE